MFQLNRFIEAIEAEGIPNQASYPPIHELDLFRKWRISKSIDCEANR